jgi:osmotically-inducible protein OsmY
MTRPPISMLVLLAAAVAGPASLTGCVPALVVAGAAGTTLVASDRRSVGAQADDESIELKIANSVNTRDQVHVNATSYNGIVLLSGEVPNQETLSSIEGTARSTDRVRAVHNELVIGPPTSMSARTNDTYITSKVKSRFVEANKFSATHVKVVTERSTVYLMGIVRHDEGDAAGQIASTTSGVVRVVKLFEYFN